MKYLLLLGLFVACTHAESKKEAAHAQLKTEYPKYVYNECTNKWAIQTNKVYGEVRYFGRPWPNWLKDSEVPNYAAHLYDCRSEIGYHNIDSTFCVLGKEFQYNSKAEAIKAYSHVLIQIHDRDIKMHIADSLSVIDKRKSDSLFKCQHSYK